MIGAVVVGAGPNGLAAALTLAERGITVRVVEAAATPGGGCRTDELTLPGFRHDVCSAVHGMARLSPFLRAVGRPGLGVELCDPEVQYAHPLLTGEAAAVYRDLDRTAESLGADGPAWRSLFENLVDHSEDLFAEVLADLRRPPRHPVLFSRFGLRGLLPVDRLARSRLSTELGRATLAGVGAHSMRRLDAPMTSALATVLAVSAHAGGWPVIRGGSGRLVEALVARCVQLGVEFDCDHRVTSLRELPPAHATLLDVTPRQFAAIAGEELPPSYRARLERFRYGPGVFKIDYALSGPVPWRAEQCRRAATVHVGGTLEQIAANESAVNAGRHSQQPYVLVVQPGVADASRAPDGRQTLWAYCHVPNGSTLDRTAAVEAQLERFAPGFRDLVLARATRTAAEYEKYDNNYVGGDINGGRAGLFQALLGPVPAWSRYATALPGVYLCSSSTPPGGGVHGMCGANAAQQALRRELRQVAGEPVVAA